MMDFSVKNNIYPNVEVIKAPQIQGALEKLGEDETYRDEGWRAVEGEEGR